MTTRTQGFINGIVSGISFGLIPLFSIPVIRSGMDDISILVYRFFFGCAAMLLVLLSRNINMRVSKGDLLRISSLSIFYVICAISTLQSYHYLASGVASSLIYTDPIWCALIGLLFFGSALSWRLTLTLFMATFGVMLLTGAIPYSGSFSFLGLFWGLLSGLSYALYLIYVPRLRLSPMPSLKLTFYVFFLGMFILIAYSLISQGCVQTAANTQCWINLILLGLIPTALSNICVTASLKLIPSTIVAILGAFEPLTAIVIGILILGDAFTIFTLLGAALILAAVTFLTLSPSKK